MESEESFVKCIPCFPKQGKKYLFICILVNAVIIWYFYGKVNHITYFGNQPNYGAVKSSLMPLQDISLFHIPLLNTKDMTPYYTEVNKNTWCFQRGVILPESKKQKRCVCGNHWFGLDCGIPEAVWKSHFMQEGKNAGIEIRRKDKPRRIIYSIIVENEYDLLNIVISNAFSVVDLFLVIQENERTPSLSKMLDQGYLAEFQHKIMPFLHNKSALYSTQDNYKYILNETWVIAWKKLTDFRPDDILMFSHTSSILSEDLLLFLKLYDGYPEPFNFKLRPLLFKFSREIINNKNSSLVPLIPSGYSFQFITSMCGYEIQNYFANKCVKKNPKNKPLEERNQEFMETTIGSTDAPSGWQCILFCKYNCSKELSLQKWFGEHFGASLLNGKPDNESVIENVLKNQNNVIDKSFKYKLVPTDDPYFAPKMILDNLKKYSYLVE